MHFKSKQNSSYASLNCISIYSGRSECVMLHRKKLTCNKIQIQITVGVGGDSHLFLRFATTAAQLLRFALTQSVNRNIYLLADIIYLLADIIYLLADIIYLLADIIYQCISYVMHHWHGAWCIFDARCKIQDARCNRKYSGSLAAVNLIDV